MAPMNPPTRGGTRHEVTMLENGAMFRSKRYRSLSQPVITGSHWSHTRSSLAGAAPCIA